ncbi:MAG TPA: hypothetical protein VIJ86_12545 [Acidimicrobiales bacterium]
MTKIVTVAKKAVTYHARTSITVFHPKNSEMISSWRVTVRGRLPLFGGNFLDTHLSNEL